MNGCKTNKSITIFEVRVWCITIIAIISSLAMMHGDTTLVSPEVNRLMGIPNYISSIILIITIFLERKSFKLYFPLTQYIIVTWFLQSFWGYNGFNCRPLTLIVLLLFCGVGEKVWRYALNKYRLFLIVISAYGILAYFSYLYSLGLPYKLVPYYGLGGMSLSSYLNYYLSLIVLTPSGIRLCGLFNEPGYYGTIVALYLISQKLNLRDKGNIILFVGGCLSFSFAFYVLLLVYSTIIILKKPQYILGTFVVLFIIFNLMSYISKNSEMVRILLERFSIEDGQLAGDNRVTERFEYYWNKMFIDGKFLFGYGHGYVAEINAHSLSFRNVILEYGFVGAIIMWSLLLKAAIKKAHKNIYSLLLVAMFFISIYQRPSIFFTQYMLILFGGISSIYKTSLYENSYLCTQSR